MIRIFCIIALVSAATGAETNTESLLNQAQAANLKGQHSEALSMATKAIAGAPGNPQAFWVRGRIHGDMKNHPLAVSDFTRCLELEPRAAQVYGLRGAEHFKLGNFTQAIADFDAAIRLAPNREAHDWQRGITYYYADRFEDGRKQFELHQTVNSNDVENAVWHFLCASRTLGIEKARAALLPIKNDTRIPMMKVYDLFAGRAKPQDVLDAAAANAPSDSSRQQQMFFAHLYLGLYYEAFGNAALAKFHIDKASHDFKQDHYMGDVARVHWKVLQARESAGAATPPKNPQP